ncbi:hypothetical protein E2C01_055778 [Portunus trituberculatus]|uniref:Uncharacterized protein n=1 Tax=Portunus trituberculatus TaxID=210409 RepID=A0A5B7GYL7_PORTR|nr:hypothetical protein [Portunus trituberculatus]
MSHFHTRSAYYLVILYSFRNLCEGFKIVKSMAINLLATINPS